MRKSKRRRRARQPAVEMTGTPFERRISTASLLLIGLILGLAGGLYYAWIVDPVIFVDASPARFSQRYREEYVLLVSQSYMADRDLARAERRLAALDVADTNEVVADLLNQYVREQKPAHEIQAVANLAQQMGIEEAAVALFAPTPMAAAAGNTSTATPLPQPTATSTITPTATLIPTATLSPTLPPSPTPRPDYQLLNQQRVCDPDNPSPRIEVVTLDAFRAPLPGIEVLVNWEGGSDRFFTGFKPEKGPSYGDFTMSTGTSYTVILAEGSPEVSGLRIETCDNTGLDGGWRLTFQHLTYRVPTVETATPTP